MKQTKEKASSVIKETARALAESGAFNGRNLEYAFREILGKDWKSAAAGDRAAVREAFFTSRKSSVESAAVCAADSDRVSVKVGARITGNGGFVTSAVVRASGLPVSSPEYRQAEEMAAQWRKAADAIASGEFTPEAIREAMAEVGWSATAIDAAAKLIVVWHASRVPIDWLEEHRVTVARVKAEIRALKP